MALIETGYLELEELAALQKLPSPERYAKGPVAVAECVQPIPCNPCESACRFGAICIAEPITNLPCLNYEKCTGCGLCAAKCPGLAIFIINKAFSAKTAAVTFPYEYYPTPEAGDIVRAVDRKGEFRCEAKVVRVQNPAGFDHTPLVTLEVPLELADEVRSMERRGGTHE